MSTRPVALTVVVAAVGLAACTFGSRSGSQTPAATASTSTTSAAPAPNSGSPAGSPAGSPTATLPSVTGSAASASSSGSASPAASTPILVLRPDGLDLVSPGGARPTRLDFGTAKAAQVDTAIARVLGGGTPKHDSLPECGQGPRVGAGRNGFSVLYHGTTFVGWADQGAKGRHLTTPAGLGVGSTLAQVRAVQADVTTMNDSLGPEFFSESGISGLLDGLKASSRVTLVYAGETCFFR